jgi:transcriptional regulator with XRE-family HTH domain
MKDISIIVRKARGFDKQEYFAARLGISQPTLCNIEKGRRNPSIPVLKRLSKLTNKPLTYLILLTYGTN